MLKQELGLKPGSQISQSAVLQVRLAKPKLSQSLQSTRSPRDVGWLAGCWGVSAFPQPYPTEAPGTRQVGTGTLCRSFRGGCTFVPSLLLMAGMPR